MRGLWKAPLRVRLVEHSTGSRETSYLTMRKIKNIKMGVGDAEGQGPSCPPVRAPGLLCVGTLMMAPRTWCQTGNANSLSVNVGSVVVSRPGSVALEAQGGRAARSGPKGGTTR